MFPGVRSILPSCRLSPKRGCSHRGYRKGSLQPAATSQPCCLPCLPSSFSFIPYPLTTNTILVKALRNFLSRVDPHHMRLKLHGCANGGPLVTLEPRHHLILYARCRLDF